MAAVAVAEESSESSAVVAMCKSCFTHQRPSNQALADIISCNTVLEFYSTRGELKYFLYSGPVNLCLHDS